MKYHVPSPHRLRPLICCHCARSANEGPQGRVQRSGRQVARWLRPRICPVRRGVGTNAMASNPKSVRPRWAQRPIAKRELNEFGRVPRCKEHAGIDSEEIDVDVAHGGVGVSSRKQHPMGCPSNTRGEYRAELAQDIVPIPALQDRNSGKKIRARSSSNENKKKADIAREIRATLIV